MLAYANGTTTTAYSMYYDLKKCGDLLDIILHCSMKQKKERRTRKETQIAIAAVAFADDDDRLF